MILVVDNYDSFTFNLVQRLGEIDADLDIRVHRNDQLTVADAEAMQPERIIISPGPCTPQEAGVSTAIISRFSGTCPILGVCLGHQSIASVYGGQVVRADRLMHGKTSMIHHLGTGVFRGLSNPFQATRYHSLVVPESSLDERFEVTAWTNDPDHAREVMGLRLLNQPTYGVQFHPESFLSPEGTQLLKNFLEIDLSGDA